MRKKLFAISGSVMISAALLLTACTTKTETEEIDKTVTVETAEVQKGTLNTEGRYIGTIENTEQVEIVAKVSGTLTEVNASVGDSVYCRNNSCL